MMSAKEPARLTLIKGAIDGAYTVKQAAKKLSMSTLWVKHLKKTVREQCGGAVIHGNAAGRHPANVTGEALRTTVPTRSVGLRRRAAHRAKRGGP